MINLFITSSPKGEGRKKTAQTEIKIVYNYLLENTATATMVSKATFVEQKNICRYKATLERMGLLYSVRKDKCKYTGKQAMYLSTSPDKDPMRNQLKFDFDNDKN